MKNDPFDMMDGRILDAFLLMQMIAKINEACSKSPIVTFEDYFKYALVEGMFMEFGVAGGGTINKIANLNPDKTIYGFDSFDGLPEQWEFHPQGLFRRDAPPEVPNNVELVAGLFQDTISPFLETHKEPASFIHIDCDLYSSAKCVLDLLKYRIVLGTIIAFDEIYHLHKNLKHEARAFAEFIGNNGFSYECIGHFGNDKAAFVMYPPQEYDVKVGIAFGNGGSR